jgi:hypothetical protein
MSRLGTEVSAPSRCLLVSQSGYGCWLCANHAGDCEPNANNLGAVLGYPYCRYCHHPVIRWPSNTWADMDGAQACEVPGMPGRYRGHEPEWGGAA